jgi:checkpoint serine/threonine-protein kinase
MQPPPAMTPAYAVPPTPTPAGAAGPGRLNIFADENHIPQSAVKMPRANIFDVSTPARPAADSAPTESAAKKAFGIFTDGDAEPAKTPLAPKAGSSVFATPAPKFGGRASRAVLQQVIAEESEEPAEEQGAGVFGEQGQDAITEGEEYEEDYEDGGRQRRPWIQNINIMTPITERTCEYTSHTALSRLSLASTSDAAMSTRRASASNVTSGAATGMQDLSVVDEEDERSRPDRSGSSNHFIDTAEPIHDSFDGHVGADFALPEGFTIHARPAHNENTMASIVDRSTRLSLAQSDDGETDTGAFVTATAGDLAAHDILGNPCCPVDDQVISTLLELIQPPLDQLPGFVDQRPETSAQLDVLNKFAKSRMRKSQNGRMSMSASDGHELQLGDREYEVMDKIGEGGFGAVFLAIDLLKRDELEDDEEEEAALVAIKIESPTALWEAVVLDRMHRKLDTALARSIVKHQSLFAFADESFLVLDYSSQGTLLDLVNKAQALNIAPAVSGAPQAMDEILAIFWTIELLRLVEGLHAAGFIHGDLKIDNCLVRLENIPEGEGGNAAWSAQYMRDGTDGWAHKGIRLIDFGRAIDLSLWPAGDRQQFLADWPVDERDCTEIKQGKSWSYQTDYAGLASVAYCMLFGKYIQTEVVDVDGQKRVKIATPLKRVSCNSLDCASALSLQLDDGSLTK